MKGLKKFWHKITKPFRVVGNWIARPFIRIADFFREEPEDAPMAETLQMAFEEPAGFLEHIGALRNHLLRAFLVLILCAIIAFLFLTLVLLFKGEFSSSFFLLKANDWLYLLILASVCTAYPFVVVTNLLKKMSPFTIVLTNNLEPVYGIVLALIIFGERERMSFEFYVGAMVIFSCVLINGLIKSRIFKGRIKTKEN